jgi:hypothetical protein
MRTLHGESASVWRGFRSNPASALEVRRPILSDWTQGGRSLVQLPTAASHDLSNGPGRAQPERARPDTAAELPARGNFGLGFRE